MSQYEEQQTYQNDFDVQDPVPKQEYYAESIALRAASLSDDPLSDFDQAMQMGPQMTNDKIGQQALEFYQGAMVQAVENDLAAGNEFDIGAISEVQSQFDYKTATKDSRYYIDSIPGIEDVAPEQRERLVIGDYINREFSKILDESGVLGTLLNLGDIFVIPDESYRYAQFYRQVTNDKSVIGNYLNSAENLVKLGQAFKILSPEEQVATFNAMKEVAVGVTDNELQQIFILMAATGATNIGEEQFSNWADKLTVAGAIGKFVMAGIKATSLVKTLAKAGDVDKAAELVDQAIKSPEAATAIHMSDIDAAGSVLPTTTGDLSSLLSQAPEGVSSQIAKSLEKIDALQEEALNYVKDDIRYILDRDPGKVEEIKTSVQARLSAEYPEMEHLRITDKGGSIKFEFQVPDGEGKLSDEVYTYTFSRNDVDGGFNAKEVTLFGEVVSGVLSPQKLFQKDRDLLVQAVERVAHSSPKIKSKLTDQLRLANMPYGKRLSSKEKSNVSKILQMGSEQETVFSYDDLVNKGIGSVRLTPREAVAYYSNRKVIDNLYFMKNDEVRDGLIARGAKNVVIGNKSGFATVMEDSRSAKLRYNTEADFKKVYNVADDTVESSITSEKIDEMYEKGYVLTKLDNTNEYWDFKGQSPKWAFVEKGQVGEIPDFILNYRDGYLPRIYDNAYWFVKAPGKAIEDGGKTHRTIQTLRYFDNETDALAYAEKYAVDNGVSKDKVSVLFDRDPLNNRNLDDDVINIFGGTFSSTRKSEPLKFGLDGQKAKYVDPLEALQRYIGHVGNRMPVSQLRVGLEQKWLNSYKDITGKRYVGRFSDAAGSLENTVPDRQQMKFLQKSHEQITSLSNIPHKHEQQLQGVFRSVGSSLEKLGPKFKGASSWMYSLSQTNPIGASKAASYHMLLGMYSAAQYPIQMLGASIAFSINPTYAAKGAPKWLAFTRLDNIKDAGIRAQAVKDLSVKLGIDDLEESYNLWKKSGYRESVLVTNGDYASLANGLPYDGNLLRRVFDKGAFFFKSGELANMRISFATSLERWKDMNKGKPLDDNALREIFARSEQFRLNMSQGNKAAFQEGYWSIPLQFQQINTKFLEAVSPGSAFTWQERARLFAGQFTLFGAMGVPFLEQMSAYVADVVDFDAANMGSEGLNAFRRGVSGFVINNVLDINAEVSGRVAIAGGFSNALIDAVTGQHDMSSIAGPSGAVWQRLAGTGSTLDVLSNAFKMTIKADDVTPAQVAQVFSEIAQSLAEVPSSTRNLILAYDLWNSGIVKDSKGRVMWMEDPVLRDVIMQAIGFQQMKKQEFYELMKMGRERILNETELVTRMTISFNRALRFAEEGDVERQRASAAAIANTLSTIRHDPKLVDRVMTSFREKVKSDDKMMKMIESEILNFSDVTSEQGTTFNIYRAKALEGK